VFPMPGFGGPYRQYTVRCYHLRCGQGTIYAGFGRYELSWHAAGSVEVPQHQEHTALVAFGMIYGDWSGESSASCSGQVLPNVPQEYHKRTRRAQTTSLSNRGWPLRIACCVIYTVRQTTPHIRRSLVSSLSLTAPTNLTWAGQSLAMDESFPGISTEHMRL
jgi:hypothetical protein